MIMKENTVYGKFEKKMTLIQIPTFAIDKNTLTYYIVLIEICL